MEIEDTVIAFWMDVSLFGESMPFVETMAQVQRTTGNGFVDSWRKGTITPRLIDVYEDFVSWSQKTGRGVVPSVAAFVVGCEGIGCQVKQIARPWVKDESVTQDKQPVCLMVPDLRQLRESLGTAEFFVQGRYDAKQAA